MKGTLIAFLLVSSVASADTGRGLVWVLQPVRAPVAPEAVQPAAPWVPGGTAETEGVVTVGPRAAAALWLDPLDVVRVRTVAGAARFGRVLGGAGTRAVLDEPGIPVEPGVTLLVQPPGRGDVWMIWGREKAELVVERPVRRRGRQVWDTVEREVRDWVARGDAGPPPALPAVAGAGEARLRLIADRQLGITSHDVAAQRSARARALVLGLRPLVDGPFALERLDVPGAGATRQLELPDDERLPWQALAAGGKWTVEVAGPGVLRVDARAVLPAVVAAARPPVKVTLRGARGVLGAASSDANPVNAPDEDEPPPAFPVVKPLLTDAGAIAGELAMAQTVLPPGKSKIEITVEGGPLIVRVTHAQRRLRLSQRIRDDGRIDAAMPWPPPAGALPELRWVCFLEEARRRAGDDARLRELLDGLRATPPPEVMAALADLLPEPTLVERARSPRLAALELAWRGMPLDPDVRGRLRAAWRGSVSSLVPPDDDPGGGKKLPRPAAWTWLVESDDGVGALAELGIGKPLGVTAAPPAGKAARMDIFVKTTAEAPGPLTLRVGNRAWSTLALEPLERLQVAVAAGAEEVRLDGPEGTRAWVSLPAAAVTSGAADLRRYWPLSDDGKSLRYELPDPGVPGAVRIALRVLEPRRGEPVRVVLRGDVGERRTFEIVPGAVDEKAMAVDAPGAVGGEVSFTVRLAPGTRVVWLSASGGGKQRVVAQVSVRRTGEEPGTSTHTITTTGEPGTGTDTNTSPEETVGRMSRRLAEHPGDVAALVERAGALLDLDVSDLARQDLVRLSRLRIGAGDGAAVNGLLDRWEAEGDSAYVGVSETPMVLANGLMGMAQEAELREFVAAVKAARQLGEVNVEGESEVAGYLRARWSEDPLELARVAAGSERVAVWIEACERLMRATGKRGASSLLFGLASRAREKAEHPRVRRALAVAAALSKWDPLDGTESNAGQERVPQGEVEPSSPGAVAREALLAAPWNVRTAHILQPGGTAAVDLELSGPTRLSTQVYCVELKVGQGPGCVISLKVDGQEIKARAAPVGEPGTVPARSLGSGKHHVEVTLGRDDPRVLASVRFLTDRPLGEGSVSEPDGYPVPVDRALRYFAATAARPVVVSILGPATLRVELRGSGTARVAVGDRTRDVEAPAEIVLLVPESGARRVTVTPQGKTARLLARLSLRQDAAGTVPPLPEPWWEDAGASSLLPWPALPAPLVSLGGDVWRGCPCGEAGTFTAEVSGGGEPLGERDSATRSLVLEVGGAWRRRLGDAPAWLRFGVAIRGREGTGPIAVVSGSFYARDLPLGLRLGLDAQAATQRFGSGETAEQAAGVRGSLDLDRPFDLTATLSFVPSVTVRAAWLSLDRAAVTAAPDEAVDPDVYNDYTRTRPLLLTARAGLWWAPLQDQLGELTFFGAAYPDLDQVGVDLTWRSLFPFLGETFVAVGYRPTYRLVTPDRLSAFLRHDVSARLRWSLWTGSTGRFVIGIDGGVTATGSGARAVAGLTLRYDFTSGRGLRDILPTDESFERLVEGFAWEPTPPGTR